MILYSQLTAHTTLIAGTTPLPATPTGHHCANTHSPALVNTLVRLAKLHPPVAVAIAMKMRHESEKVFFDLMANAGFRESETLEFELPGDVNVGEEVVFLHVYRRRHGRG